MIAEAQVNSAVAARELRIAEVRVAWVAVQETAAALSKAGRLSQAFRKPCVMNGIDLMSGR